jgi:hypothetical protein
LPEFGVRRPDIISIRVDFPLPVIPTIPVIFLAGIKILISFNKLFLLGYEK